MSIYSEASRKDIVDYLRDADNQARIDLNSKLFQILEGQLSGQLDKKLYDDLGQKSYLAAKDRMAPINYYRKVIDKITSIYSQGVVRKVIDGTDADEELLRWYEDILNLDMLMNVNNEALNAYKYSLLQITLDDPDPLTLQRKPFIRTIPNHEYLIKNLSRVDPTAPDMIILFMGERQNGSEREKIYHVYTDDEFMVINHNGDVINSGDDDGLNPYGIKPFVYGNASQNLVMPSLRTDDFNMALLVPLLLTDLNYSVKFQAFSAFVAMDIDEGQIEISPNSIIHLKSDGVGEKASFDTIKPTVDIAEVLNLASSQISLWLSSKGIRPGTIGTTAADQFSSGISKMIDESDTFESRKKQIEIYQVIERDFWDRLLKTIHPYWVQAGLVDNRTIFSPSASIVTEFQDPKPLQTRMELIEEIKAIIDAGLESRRGALAALHPDWSDEEIDLKLEEIDNESSQRMNKMMGAMNNGGFAGNEN